MSGGFSGGCLCGAVTYEITNDPMLAGHCHCIDCRRSSGNIVSRGFRPNCGSALYSKNDGLPGMVFPRASSLDDPDLANPAIVVYASRAVAWDPVDPALPAFDEMPEGDLVHFLAESA